MNVEERISAAMKALGLDAPEDGEPIPRALEKIAEGFESLLTETRVFAGMVSDRLNEDGARLPPPGADP